MEKVIRKGATVILIYILLIGFVLFMTERVQRLESNNNNVNVGVKLFK